MLKIDLDDNLSILDENIEIEHIEYDCDMEDLIDKIENIIKYINEKYIK